MTLCQLLSGGRQRQISALRCDDQWMTSVSLGKESVIKHRTRRHDYFYFVFCFFFLSSDEIFLWRIGQRFWKKIFHKFIHFFQAAVVPILLYGCTTWTLTKRLKKKLDGNYTRMLRAILNKSWRQHHTRHQLYGHLPPITKTIQVRRTRHTGHCWRSKDELISDVLLWTPAYGQAKAGRPARTYIQQLCEDMGCSPEDLPKAINDREKWRESVRDIRAGGTTWWWWWWFFNNHLSEKSTR